MTRLLCYDSSRQQVKAEPDGAKSCDRANTHAIRFHEEESCVCCCASRLTTGAEIIRIVGAPDMKENLANQGAEVLTTTRERFADFIPKQRAGQR
jgi:hypothetical protein